MKRTQLLSTMFATTLFAGCLGSDPPSEPPIARFIASEKSVADLGVKAWEVYTDGDDTRVIGIGDGLERRAEAVLRRDAATANERVRIEGVYPERGEVQLSSEGVVESGGSGALRTLALDINADLGKGKTSVLTPIVSDDDKLGVASSALVFATVDQQGIHHMGWNLWGYCHYQVLGNVCRSNHVRDHIEIFTDGGSYYAYRWEIPFSGSEAVFTDCRANITTCVDAGRWDNFHWSTWSIKKNLAKGKSAIQSSTDWGGDALRAADGNTDGDFWHGSVTHTLTQVQPWWQVDLGGVSHVAQVVIFNRTDCCRERLADLDIEFSTDGVNYTIATQTFGPTNTNNITLATNGQARFIRVKLRGTGILSLAEVEIYAN